MTIRRKSSILISLSSLLAEIISRQSPVLITSNPDEMNVRRMSLAFALLFLAPLPFYGQASSAWAHPTVVGASELFSTLEFDTLILAFFSIVLLLGCCFLLSILFSVRELWGVPESTSISRKKGKAPDLVVSNNSRVAVIRRFNPNPSLQAAGDQTGERGENHPSRTGEEKQRGE